MPRLRLAGSAGLALLPLLALTGCGGAEPAGAESAPAASEGEPASDVPEAPAYAEIEAELWETMQTADSVAIIGEMPRSFLHPESEDEREARLSYEFTGAVDGADSTRRTMSDEALISDARLVGEAYYEPAEVALDNFVRNVGDWGIPESAWEESEGQWVEWTDLYDAESRTTEAFLEDLRAVLEGRDPLTTLDGETQTRDGEDVWVYSDGTFEAVVRPGEEPVLLSCVGEGRDGTFELQFSDWNSSEGPGAPPEDETMTRAEFGDLLSD